MRFLPRALYSIPCLPPIRIHFQSCWNCGRPALETCGGCGIARYCGSFCQHRDWEAGGHHATCNNPPPREPRRSASRSPPRIASAAQSSVNEANIVAPIPASGTTKGKWRYDGNYYRLRRFARPVQYDSRWPYTHARAHTYTYAHAHPFFRRRIIHLLLFFLHFLPTLWHSRQTMSHSVVQFIIV